jgi:hypothetical protein
MNVDFLPDMPSILCSDWNLHHKWWECLDSRASRQANRTVEWLREHSYQLENNPNTLTYQSHDGQTLSTLDLTFLNPWALHSIYDWAIDAGLSFRSDHYTTKWTIDLGATLIPDPAAIKFNWKQADVPAFQKMLRQNFECCHQSFLPLYCALPSLHQIEEAVQAFAQCMEQATASTVPLQKALHHAKPWWTQLLSNLLTEIQDQQHEVCDKIWEYGRADDESIRTLRLAHNTFKSSIRKAKCIFYNEKLCQATYKTIWDFKKWMQACCTYPSPAISQGLNQPPAVYHADKCNTLWNVLFPDVAEDLNIDIDTLAPHPEQYKWPPVTCTEVHKALFRQSPKKAPGPDRILFRALRWAWTVGSEQIYQMIAVCVQVGYHPRPWRESILVALQKAHKPDYSQPRAYRLIALLPCISKVLERVQAKRLSYLAAKYHLVLLNQFGSVPGCSTEDAILSFVHDVEAVQNHSLVTSTLTFDFQGYFDNISHSHLVNLLYQKQFPLLLIRWVGHFVTSRKTAVCLDGICAEMAPVNMGIPQGSNMSPGLAAIFSSPLNKRIEAWATQYQQEHPDLRSTCLTLIIFVDNRKFYVSSPSLDTNVVVLAAAYAEAEGWGLEVGINFDAVNWELSHYTWQTRDRGVSLTMTISSTLDPISDVSPSSLAHFHLTFKTIAFFLYY